MGDLRPDNGGGWPPDDGGPHRDGLPDLPPEWGTVVIPDDPSELAHESAAIRRELRKEARSRVLRQAVGLPPAPVGVERSGIGIPIVIMAVAILTTLVSLFVVTWDRRPAAPRPTTAVSVPLTELAFSDSSGQPVRVAGLLPAVILLVDGCECGDLIRETARTVPATVTVVPIARAAPAVTGAPVNVRSLADPNGVLRTRFIGTAAQAPGAAAALLVDRDGTVIKAIAAIKTVTDLGADFTRLTR